MLRVLRVGGWVLRVGGWVGVPLPLTAMAVLTELRAVLYFISSFPFLLAFGAGGHGFEFCVFVAG